MLEVDGARCPSCAINGFSLWKAPFELKNFLAQLFPVVRKHLGNSDFLLGRKSSVDIVGPSLPPPGQAAPKYATMA